MTADDVLEIMARLERADCFTLIMGGWGVDAIIGRQTRPHDDLDLMMDTWRTLSGCSHSSFELTVSTLKQSFRVDFYPRLSRGPSPPHFT